jgi:glutamate-1-semialdehyde 2,1-aminomutase
MSGPIREFARGREMAERLEALVPGGSHTYSKGRDQFPARSPRMLVRAKGAYCWDPDGNRFLDWAMGNRVICLGHAYKPVDEAVKRQIDEGLNFSRPSKLELELADYLTGLIPVAEMVKFGKNGSDVTTAAVKLARAYTGRPLVAYCADHPFFSIHDWFIGTTPVNAGIPEEAYRQTLRFPYNDLAAVRALFARHPGQIAALILEPVKNDEPHEGYLQGLRELCTREGAALIFDEMISGVRFDLRGAHHLYGVAPDLACFGKAISNGYAFSFLAGRRDLLELGGLKHEGRRVFLLSQTHGSEAVGMAACRETLSECERLDVTRHIWALGKRLVEGMRALARSEKVESHVRALGFDCNPQILCTREDGSYWPELHTAFHEEVISHGVLIPWTTITYAHGEEELAATLAALEAGMRRVRRVLEDGSVATAFVGEVVRPVFRPFNRCRLSRCGRLDPEAPREACCVD